MTRLKRVLDMSNGVFKPEFQTMEDKLKAHRQKTKEEREQYARKKTDEMYDLFRQLKNKLCK